MGFYFVSPLTDGQGIRVVDLWFHARRFAREEELSLTASIPMRLNVLASQLVMSNWEVLFSLGSNIIDPNITRFIQHRMLPIAKDGGIIEELLHARPINIWEKPKDDKEAKRDLELYNLMVEFPSSINVFPKIESRMIYLKHLSNMAKGSKWEQLNNNEFVSIILKLRNWVIKWQKNVNQKDTIQLFTRIVKTSMLPEEAFPIKLYKLVGFSLEENKK